MLRRGCLFSQVLRPRLFGLGILIYGGPNRDIQLGGSVVDISHFGFGEDSSCRVCRGGHGDSDDR